MIGKIYGTGSYVPHKVVTNDDLSKIMDTNDEWIRERTGIGKRHIIEEETTASMSVGAAQAALENAGVEAEELDLIIVSTLSPNVVVPCVACEVQKEIGAKNAACFDLNAACTGFLVAYNTAQAYINVGLAKKALIIGAESLSNIMDWADRGTSILFGDGAGAAVLVAEEGTVPPMIMHSDGAKGDALLCKSRANEHETLLRKLSGDGDAIKSTAEIAEDTYVRMNGQEVFRFAVRRVPQCIEEILEISGLKLEEIDLFVLHQANQRIVESVAKRLHTDIERFPMNLMEYGNTSSASIPILLDELNRSGKLKKGMKLILAGFGAGLSWGAAYVEW